MFIFIILLFFFVFNKSLKLEYNLYRKEKINLNYIKSFDEVNNSNNDDLLDISSNYERINPNDPNYFYIPIISSSDIHGHFYPEEYKIGNFSFSRGGLDYLAKYINIIKKEFQNNILYLEAGDLFQGGTESTITNGEIILDYLNLMNANGSTFGNHEYDKNREFIEEKVCKAKFPFLATNMYDTKKKTKKVLGENHFTSKIYTFDVPNNNINKNNKVNQIKIGVVGLTIKMTENQIAGKGFEGIIFLEYKDELIMEANKLRNENGVNAIILLSHISTNCGKEDNLTLNMYKPSDIQEKCSPNSDLYILINSLDKGIVDAVVTGHSHREVHHWINNIPVISPINNGLYTNIIYLAFDKKNNYNLVHDKVRIEGPLPVCEKIFHKNYKCEIIKPNELEDYLPLTEYKFHDVKIEKDPILKTIHDKYDEIYKNYSEEICSIIGTDDILMVSTNGSFYLGNILADIYRYITGAQISIVSYGNIRSDLIPGRIPRYKIKDLQPFGNNFCSFIMNGDEIKRMMKIIQIGRKKYYITSGLKQILAKNNNGDYYLSNIKLFDGYKEFELIPNKEYLVSANNFLIEIGGDDFYNVLSWYKPRNLTCDYGKDFDLVEQFVRDQQIIDVRNYMDENNPRIRFIE